MRAGTRYALAFLVMCACERSEVAPRPSSPAKADATVDVVSEGVAVCSHLVTVGCLDGQDASDCARSFTAAQGRMVDFKPVCLMSATTRDAVEACGTMRCLPPR